MAFIECWNERCMFNDGDNSCSEDSISLDSSGMCNNFQLKEGDNGETL